MSEQRPKRESMSIEEDTVSNMWEIAAIVEVLERKGLRTKQDLYDIITEFRRKTPRAKIAETAFPEPYLLTETQNMIIDDILALLNINLKSASPEFMTALRKLEFGIYFEPVVFAQDSIHRKETQDEHQIPDCVAGAGAARRRRLCGGAESGHRFRSVRRVLCVSHVCLFGDNGQRI